MVVPEERNSSDILFHRSSSRLSHPTGYSREDQLSQTRKDHQVGLLECFSDRECAGSSSLCETTLCEAIAHLNDESPGNLKSEISESPISNKNDYISNSKIGN